MPRLYNPSCEPDSPDASYSLSLALRAKLIIITRIVHQVVVTIAKGLPFDVSQCAVWPCVGLALSVPFHPYICIADRLICR